MKLKSSRKLGTALVLATALVAACGSDDGGAATEQPNGTDAAPISTSDVQPSTASTVGTATASSSGADAPSSTDPSGPPETTSLKIGLAAVSPVFLPTQIAAEMGFFEEEGLEVEIAPFQGGPATVQALVAGEIDITEQDYPPVMSTFGSPADVVVLRTTSSAPAYTFMGSEGIETWEDLVDSGGTVGVSAIGGMDYILFRHVIGQAGFDPDSVNYRAAGGPADRARGLLDGQLNAIASGRPGTYELEAAGLPQIADLSDFLDGFPLEQYATTREFYDNNPNTIAALNRAFDSAAQWIEDNLDDAVEVAMASVSAPADQRENYVKTVEYYLPYWGVDTPPMEGYELLTQYYVDNSLVEGMNSVEEVHDKMLVFNQ